MKRYCFDIDGTICTNTWGDYEEAIPFYNRISMVNELYDKQNYIIYFTARGMGTCNGDIKKIHDKWYDFTENQLMGWNCKYNELMFGKPYADSYIDDRGISDKDFFENG